MVPVDPVHRTGRQLWLVTQAFGAVPRFEIRTVSNTEQRRRVGCDWLQPEVAGRPRAVPPDGPSFAPELGPFHSAFDDFEGSYRLKRTFKRSRELRP
jgi:hypothetical protein